MQIVSPSDGFLGVALGGCLSCCFGFLDTQGYFLFPFPGWAWENLNLDFQGLFVSTRDLEIPWLDFPRPCPGMNFILAIQWLTRGLYIGVIWVVSSEDPRNNPSIVTSYYYSSFVSSISSFEEAMS